MPSKDAERQSPVAIRTREIQVHYDLNGTPTLVTARVDLDFGPHVSVRTQLVEMHFHPKTHDLAVFAKTLYAYLTDYITYGAKEPPS